MSDRPKQAAGWLRPVLLVSLTLNLLILGALGGGLVMHGAWGGQERHGGFRGGPLTRALSHEDRRAIGRDMRAAYKSDGMPSAPERDAAFEGLLADLRAVPFDVQPLSKRLARRQAMMQAHLELGQRLLLERLSEMSDSDRAEFANRLSEQRATRHDKKR